MTLKPNYHTRFQSGKYSPEEAARIERYVMEVDINPDYADDLEVECDDLQFTIDTIPSRFKKVKLTVRIAAIAAAILVVLGIGVLFLTPDNKLPAAYANDIDPGRDNNAVLTLADGTVINLSDTKSGALSSQSGVAITKSADGSITYTLSDSKQSIATQTSPELQFNTLRTPPAGQAKIILADGSKVWLNAASSLKYPVIFHGREKEDQRTPRLIELSGEAYFEVAKNKLSPFIVKTDKQKVTVLGTEFNISAYQNEAAVKTTLLEGSVKVTSLASQDIILKPNQQSTLTHNNILINTVDTDEAVAWKNGEFIFRNEPLESIMLKIARWYNVSVIYENKQVAKKQFGGMISRSGKISEVLCVLESTGDVHFKVEGRKVTVMQ